MPLTVPLIRIVFLLLVIASSCFAEKLPLKIYTSADGLGSSVAFNVVRDSRGFIWLCSRDGLVRFDGYRFITYRIGDELADTAVFDIIPTRSGEYWIHMNRGTNYKFTAPPDDRVLSPRGPGGDVKVPFLAEPTTGIPFPQFEDDKGNLWTAQSDGIYQIIRDGSAYRTERYPIELPGNPNAVMAGVEFHDARVGDGFWIGTNWGVVRWFPDGRQVHTSIDPVGNTDIVRLFADDDAEHLWIAQPDGLIVLKANNSSSSRAMVRDGKVYADGSARLPETPGEASKFKFDDLLSGFTPEERSSGEFSKPIIVALYVSADGTIWIATNQGLITFDGQRFRHFTTKNGFATNELVALTEGLDGSMWIASNGGLHRLNPAGLRSFDESDGIQRSRIQNIFEDHFGRLEVIVGNFVVSSFDGSRFESARPAIPSSEIYSWQSSCGFRDSQNDLWLHTNKNVYRFSNVGSVGELKDRRPAAVYNESKGPIGRNIAKIFEDSGRNLWFSSYLPDQRVLTRLDRQTGEFSKFQMNGGSPDVCFASGLAEVAPGDLWFSFSEGGLERYRNGEFSAVESPSAPVGNISGMYRDSKERVWLATTREGLFRVDDPTADTPTFRRFTTADGLTSNNVRSITEDKFGNIYAGTVRGVNRLSPDTGRVRYYGIADGLASDFVNTLYTDRGGDVWIGTLNGLSRLTPVREQAANAPRILISGLRIAGEDYSVSPLGQQAVFLPDLSSGQQNIQIDFLSTDFSVSSPIRYQYRLGDGEWSRPSTESTVNFAGLPAGTFRFEVRGVNEQGLSSAAPAVVNFTVLRPVWQRWWFVLIAAFAIAFVMYAMYRYKISHAVKLERIRTRIASDLHDDIGSSLSQIAILSEVAKQKAGDNGASEPLKKIADTSREMVDSISDIVWAINPQKDTLGDLVSRMRRFAEETFDAKDIAYKFAFAASFEHTALGTDTRRDAYLIFKEAINNIVKHARAENVDISVSTAAGSLKVSITDDGVGYAEPSDPNETFPGFGGNGLVNMRRRADQAGGKFEFISAQGAGTTVEFSLPARSGVKTTLN